MDSANASSSRKQCDTASVSLAGRPSGAPLSTAPFVPLAAEETSPRISTRSSAIKYVPSTFTYFCLFCDKLKLTQAEVQEHYLEHLRSVPDSQFKVGPCEVNWINSFLNFQESVGKSKYKLRNHGYVDCVVCQKITEKYSLLKPISRFRIKDFQRHIRFHLCYAVYYCAICFKERSLVDDNLLIVTQVKKATVNTIHQIVPLPSKVKPCLERYADNRNVLKHLMVHHISKEPVDVSPLGSTNLRFVSFSSLTGRRQNPVLDQLVDSSLRIHQNKLQHIRDKTLRKKPVFDIIRTKIWTDHIRRYQSKLQDYIDMDESHVALGDLRVSAITTSPADVDFPLVTEYNESSDTFMPDSLHRKRKRTLSEDSYSKHPAIKDDSVRSCPQLKQTRTSMPPALAKLCEQHLPAGVKSCNESVLSDVDPVRKALSFDDHDYSINSSGVKETKQAIDLICSERLSLSDTDDDFSETRTFDTSVISNVDLEHSAELDSILECFSGDDSSKTVPITGEDQECSEIYSLLDDEMSIFETATCEIPYLDGRFVDGFFEALIHSDSSSAILNCHQTEE
ncbi:hypothetical protein HDE_11149 [Halotydeus destructor]|nr:hypothetical protein HDE_11149 [Halotydeus destructor]